jgi:AcrR family transcriptional regulator
MDAKLPLRERKAARTRNAIIDAATQLFEQQGFVETTLNQIADLADVHKQTVLRYFGTKEDIALALRIATLEHFHDELMSPDRTESVIQIWRRFVSRSSKNIAAHPDQFRFHKFILSNDKIVAQLVLLERKYERVLAEALAREAGVDPTTDMYSKLLAGMLVAGNFMVGNSVFARGAHTQLEAACLAVVDFAIEKFPPREA